MGLPKGRRERVLTTSKLVVTLVYAATYAPCSAAWIASFVHVPLFNIPGSRVHLKRGLHHRPTSLSISRRDFDALRGDGDGDAEEKADAAAAAEAARNMLERMWASSETSSEESSDEGETLNPSHEGDGGPLRNIFPTSCERGALEASTACRKALLDGRRGLIIDVEVRQLEDVHPEFDPKLLAYFVGEIAKPLATMVGQVKIMYRGDRILHAAEEVMEEWKREALAREMEMRDDVAFCSYVSQVGPEDDGYLDQMVPFAETVAAQLEEDDRLVIVTSPKTMGDTMVVRKVIEAAQGRPVLVINPRMSNLPLELIDFETTYALQQFKVVPVKMDMRKMARRSPIKVTKSQRRQQHVEYQAGHVVPRVMAYRIYPDPFKLYIDSEDKGFELVESYDRKPMVPTLCLRAQIFIGQRQREVAAELRRTELERERQERLKGFGDLDNQEHGNDEEL